MTTTTAATGGADWAALWKAAAKEYRTRLRDAEDVNQKLVEAALRADVLTLTAERDQTTERVKDVLDCLHRVLCTNHPFTLSERAEVQLAIDALRRILAAAPAGRQVGE